MAKMGSENRRRRMKRLLERDERTCWLCGGRVHRKNATMDHIIPVSLGGAHSLDNLKLAHRHCNQARGNAVGLAYERQA